MKLKRLITTIAIIGLGVGLWGGSPVRAEEVTLNMLRRSPALRFALKNTPDGKRVLEHFAPGLSVDEQFEKVLARAKGDEGWFKRLSYVAQSRLYYPEALKDSAKKELPEAYFKKLWFAPLERWDQQALGYAARDYLSFEVKSDKVAYFSSLPERSEGVTLDRLRARGAPPEAFEQDWAGWVKWVNNENTRAVIDPKIRGEKMLKEARYSLLRRGMDFPGRKFDGFPALSAEPSPYGWLGRFSSGMSRCYGVSLIYCPELLEDRRWNGAYSKGPNVLFLPHESITATKANPTTAHEIVHVDSAKELRSGRVHSFHGEIGVGMPQGLTSDFSYARKGMNFEEIATFAMSLRTSAQALGVDKDNAVTLKLIQEYSRRGMDAAEFGRTFCEKAYEQLVTGKGRIEKLTELRDFRVPFNAVMNMEMNNINYRIEIPILLNEDEISSIRNGIVSLEGVLESRLKKELPKRIELYTNVKKSYRPIFDLLQKGPALTNEEIIALQKSAYQPRHLTMEELYSRRKQGCIGTNLGANLRLLK